MRHQKSSSRQSKVRGAPYLAVKDKRGLVVGLLLMAFLLLVTSNSFAVAAESKINKLSGIQLQAINQQGLVSNNELQDDDFLHAMAAYERAEYHLAFRLLLPVAQQGHTESQFYMGMLYDMGLGVASNPVKAVSWYKKAAENGYHHAQHNLAVAYANGDGVELDFKYALHWWQRAAKQGNTDSQYNLGIIYAMGNEQVEQNLLEAEKWWRKAAISGDAMAQYNLGTLYANGEKKVTSYCEAIRWWQASARSGVEQALAAIEVIKQRPDYRPC